MAYSSWDPVTGHIDVYVRPFPAVEQARWQVSTAGGSFAVWSRDGRELFYRDPAGRLLAVAVDTRDIFQAGEPRLLLSRTYYNEDGPHRYDVSSDGRFLVIKDDPASAPPRQRIVVLQNPLPSR